jgi:hypothetical protein
MLAKLPRVLPERCPWSCACRQWFMLTRRHAEVVVQDEVVDQAFRQHCWVAQDWNERFCVSDEHYVPTLLAWSGMETETTCSSSVTYTEWRGRAPHPTTFTDATAAVLAQLRGGCNGSALEAASVEAVGRLLASDQQQGKVWRPGRRAAGGNSSEGPGAGPSAAIEGWMTSSCPLFARKVSGQSIPQWLDLLRPVMRPS